jgi:hypothetical protein
LIEENGYVTTITTYYKNNKIKSECQTFNDENGLVHKCTNYHYDKFNRLIERNDQDFPRIHYYYNDKDSLVKEVKVYKDRELNSDTIVVKYYYDSQNRLIEIDHFPSTTYCKTFPLACDEAPVDLKEFFLYDTCITMKDMDILQNARSYKMFYDWGFIELNYVNNTLNKKIYTRQREYNSIIETYDGSSRITSYDDFHDFENELFLPSRMEYIGGNIYTLYSIIYKNN